MESAKGTVVSVTFKNEENGFAVAKIIFEKSAIPVTCTGLMPMIEKGEPVSVRGRWETHPKFGRQFLVEEYTRERPMTIEGIVKFLGSGVAANIGPKRAQQIVDRFGPETLEILDRDPRRLTEIPGIGLKTVKKITEKWNRNEKFRKLLLYLQEFDVSLSLALKIQKKYGDKAQDTIHANPYILCEDIQGIGFLKADQIAGKMGFSHDSHKRIEAGIVYTINESSQEGHTCVPDTVLQRSVSELLGVEAQKVHFSIDHLVAAGALVRENENIFPAILYRAEKEIAASIRDHLLLQPGFLQSEAEIQTWLNDYEKRMNWVADPVQRLAILAAAEHPMMLLTGGPGTGKTTVLKVLVAYFIAHHQKVLLAAPTGRAAQRMTDVTGITAQTIHRMIEYRPTGGEQEYAFGRNKRNPLEADVIIVDEASMIDVLLMSKLCAAVPVKSRLVFVGDNNQLPSVGPGNVLADMIDSCAIRHISLKNIFRQARNSRIITAAHEINGGITPIFSNSREENCFFLEEPEPQKALELLIEVVTQRLPSKYQLNPVHDIQVLSPMHKGLLGTEHITTELQKLLRSSSEKIGTGRHLFYLGDKVMQIRNNYDKNIFNGDIGIIADIVDETGILVKFQSETVSYKIEELEELVPAYCISIHKSQGSEFNTVVIPVSTQHYIMLQKNLVYTALTRAKRMCVFIGSRRALQLAVSTDKATIRYSCLSRRLKEASGGRN